MNAPPFDTETLFCEVVVRNGLATREQLAECRKDRSVLAAAGLTSLPTLGELLVGKGYLTEEQARHTLEHLGAKAAPGETEWTSIVELPSPEESVAPGVERCAEVDTALGQEGNEVGKYVRVAKLGAGGMGEVWKAWDRELRRWAALKFLKSDDAEYLARFMREARIAAGLSHPNIAAVYEVGEAGGRHWIAMRYVEGQTLSSFPRHNTRILVQLIRDAALAVHAAHERGIVHRDLKPDNLMVERGPLQAATGLSPASTPRLFVMDFGLAKPSEKSAALSQTGTILGTPQYMSPEQARGQSRRVDGRSDVYSLGATLYDLLAGHPPHVGVGPFDVLEKVVHEEPGRLGKANVRVDPNLESVVMKALHKDPARRYQSALDLAEDLSRWLEGEPVLVRPLSPLGRLGRRIARQKVLIATAGAVAILLTAGFLLLLAYRRSDRERSLRRELSGTLARAEKAIGENRLEDALRDFGVAETLDPGNRRAQKGLARVREAQRTASRRAAERANRWAQERRAEDLVKKVADALASARTLLEGGRLDGAAQEYAVAERLQPGNAEAIAGLAKVEAALRSKQRGLIAELLSRARKEGRSDPGKARALFEQVLAADTGNPEALAGLRDLDQAERGKRRARIQALLADANRKKKESLEAAKALYELVLREDPRNTEALTGLRDADKRIARSHSKSGRKMLLARAEEALKNAEFDLAIECAQRVLKEQIDDATALRIVGEARRGKSKALLAAARKAVGVENWEEGLGLLHRALLLGADATEVGGLRQRTIELAMTDVRRFKAVSIPGARAVEASVASFSSDGKRFAIGGRTLQVYETKSLAKLATIATPSGRVTDLAFIPGDHRLVVLKGGRLTLWNADGYRRSRTAGRKSSRSGWLVSGLSFSGDGKFLLVVGQSLVHLFSIDDWTEVRPVTQMLLPQADPNAPTPLKIETPSNALWFSNGNSLAVLQPRSRGALLLTIPRAQMYRPGEKAKVLHSPPSVDRRIVVPAETVGMSLGPDEKSAFVLCRDGAIWTYDLGSGSRIAIHDPGAENAAVFSKLSERYLLSRSIALSTTGRFVAAPCMDESGSSLRSLKLLSVSTGRLLRRIGLAKTTNRWGPAIKPAFSPDGRMLIFGESLWRAEELKGGR